MEIKNKWGVFWSSNDDLSMSFQNEQEAILYNEDMEDSFGKGSSYVDLI